MIHSIFAKALRWLILCLVAFNCYTAYAETSAAQWLADYSLLDAHAPLFVWKERVPSEAAYVTGCRLAPGNGSPPFDVYFDENGLWLTKQELSALGVSGKQWDSIDIDIPTALVRPAEPEKTRALLPHPPGMHSPPLYSLEPLNHEQLLEEDAQYAQEAADSMMRYGANRDLGFEITLQGRNYSLGTLNVKADGTWLWELQLQSIGALGVRICFDKIVAPDGVEVFVYNPDVMTEYFNVLPSENAVWTPSIQNDTVGILSRGVSVEQLNGVYLEISRIIHVYRSPTALEKAVGSCHIDVACRSEWGGHALAVGRLGIVDYDAWACSGALIVAPGYEENPPFLLTANHCVNFQARADTLEVWWLYQRADCEDELPPSVATLPRSTGGAILLAGAGPSSGSDFSLLLLHEPPPTLTAFLGYTTRPVAISESVVCIHHPQGTEKRVSFGVTSDTGSPRFDGQAGAPYEYYHEVLWLEASTEGGSSGSPLLLEETGQIIGQLYGGYASCDAMDEPDYFGRMDVTYPLIEPWLSGRYSIEGESNGEGEMNEGEGEETFEGEPSEGEGEGESGGEGEDEQEGEGEEPMKDCFCGLIECPEDGCGAPFFRYIEIILAILLSLGGLLLAHLFLSSKP